jgi:hypothetical protein
MLSIDMQRELNIRDVQVEMLLESLNYAYSRELCLHALFMASNDLNVACI